MSFRLRRPDYPVATSSAANKRGQLWLLRRLPFGLLLLLGLACQVTGTTVTPPPTSPLQEVLPTVSTGSGQPLSGTALTEIATAPLPEFAAWNRPEIRNLPGQADSSRFPAIERINNPADLWPLNDAQRDQLASQGFVIQPPGERFFHDIYLDAAADGRPIFLTTDVILHATQLVLANTWAEVENGQLRDDLSVLASSMSDASQGQWAIAPPSLQPAAAQTTAYYAVAARLLDPSYPVPETIASKVNEELILIQQARGIFKSPLFGYEQDYGRFRAPAGYANPAERAAYFQAAEWLSSMGWRLDGAPDDARQNGLSLLILLNTLESSQNWTRWERIATTHAYFLGPPTTATLADFAAVARQNYDGRLPDINSLSDSNRLDNYLLTLQAVEANEAHTLYFRPVAQWPDRDMLTGLTFNRVGLFNGDPLSPPRSAADTTVGLIRALPLALDVAAAFGSTEAQRLLSENGETQFEGYNAQLNNVSAPAEITARTGTLNQSWLQAMDPLFTPATSITPLFMRADSWRLVQLASWVGGWSELRRDHAATSYPLADPTIFAPEPGTMPATTAYLAPEPEIYAGLAATVTQLHSGLSARGLLSAETDERLSTLVTILSRLQALAEQELAGVELRADEERFLRLAVPELLGLAVTSTGQGSEVAMIATLYTDPNSSQLWQIGLGSVQPIFVLVPDDEGYTVAVGGVNSLYGFGRPAGDPLTNNEWLLGDRPESLFWQNILTTP